MTEPEAQQGTRRIVVFTADLSFSVRRTIVDIDRAIPGCEWLLMVHRPHKSPGLLLRNQWKNLRYHGWRWLPYQSADILGQLLARMSRKGAAAAGLAGPGSDYTMAALEKLPNVNVVCPGDIHSQVSVECIQSFAPSLGLSLAAPILKEAVFTIPVQGTLNLHRGKLPNYRGMPPAFWELCNGESEVGCSVHDVVASLDAGRLVAQATVPVKQYSTLKGLQLELDITGIRLMTDTVQRVFSGTASYQTQEAGGKLYRKPTLKQQAQLAVRLRSARSLKQRSFQGLKDAYFFLAVHLNRLFLRRMGRQRLPVLLYHRVSDDARDNLTVGIEQFDRQMEMLARYYNPVSLDELLEHSPRISTLPHPVCVSFDDGYLDNFTNAAPILIKHGIPAAFFVSTGIVGSERGFPHDEHRASVPIPNMNWQDIQEMYREGFHIGSHTVSHIDCAGESRETVERELLESLADIRSQLGNKDVVLAYPYGGREHMTADRLQLVRETGYAACLSAYGGVNFAPVDVFNVLRGGIDCNFSELAFRYRCEGLK